MFFYDAPWFNIDVSYKDSQQFRQRPWRMQNGTDLQGFLGIQGHKMGKVTLFYNCTLLRSHKLIKDDLWVQDGLIIDPRTAEYTCDDSIDCGGALISPGFIDLKMNGGFGVDFSKFQSGDVEAEVEMVAKRLPETGVTTFCPTIVTSNSKKYQSVLPLISARDGSERNGAGILGVHLDGPFISSKRPGAHDPELIQKFDNGFESVKSVYGDLENVRLITLAPELEHAPDVIRQLNRWGIKVSLGHSACTLAEAEAAVHAGASMLTHLFNAMPTFHHRDPSLVGLLAVDLPENREVYFGLIADGNHTHPAALRMAHRIAPKSLFLVTDGVAPLGLGKGRFTLGSTDVIVDGQSTPRCTVEGTETLSGSVSPMICCVRNFKKHTGCSTVYALETATLHPALAMNIADKKGTLEFSTDADLVFLDPQTLIIKSTYIRGRKVFEAEEQ